MRRWAGLLSVPLMALAFVSLLTLRGGAQNVPEKRQYIRKVTMISKFLAADFVPNGDLSKDVWKDATRVTLGDRFSHKPLPGSEMQVASLWTPRYIYLAYWCRFRSLNIYEGEDPAKERWELWNRDVVEAFLNPQPDRFLHYYEFEVAPNNQWIDLEIDLSKNPMNDAAWNSHFEHSTKLDAEHKSWTAEMRIPASSMNAGVIKAGDEWRINLYRCDGQGDDTKRRFLSWSPLPAGKNESYHQPAAFGLLKFVK